MTDIEKLKAESVKFAEWQNDLCPQCKAKITQKMQPVAAAYNAGGFKRKWAEAKMAAMTMTLWRDMCPKCIKKIRQKVAVKE